MTIEGKTFQEQHTRIFKFAFLTFCYAPGIEKKFKSKILHNLYWLIAIVPCFLALPFIFSFLYYLISTPLSTILMAQLFRRALVMMYMTGVMQLYMFRYRAIDDIFDQWNDIINGSYCIAERKVILDRVTARSAKIMLFASGFRFLTAISYCIPLCFDRYMNSSELAGMPHDKNSPYHFYYVGYQTLFFFWIGIPIISVELLNSLVLCMAEAEVELLSDKLAEILSAVGVLDEDTVLVRENEKMVEVPFGGREYKNSVSKVNHELGLWIKAHQAAKKWIEQLINFMHLNITLKYLYLVIHCSLIVIGIDGLAQNYNDLFLIATTPLINFSMLFYTTKQVDRLRDDSERLFFKAYGQGWYLYPARTQKTLSVIAAVVQAQPIKFFWFKIFEDSKEIFLGVLQTAYQVLTFLLPMTA